MSFGVGVGRFISARNNTDFVCLPVSLMCLLYVRTYVCARILYAGTDVHKCTANVPIQQFSTSVLGSSADCVQLLSW